MKLLLRSLKVVSKILLFLIVPEEASLFRNILTTELY